MPDDRAKLTRYDWYFIVAMLIHFVIDGFSRFQLAPYIRFTVYFAMFIVGWMFVFEPHRHRSSFAKSLTLAALAFFMPYILNIGLIVNSIGIRNIDIILAVLPVYLLYFFFIQPDLLSQRLGWMRTVYIWIFIIIFISWSYQAGRAYVTAGTLEFIPGLGGPAAADVLGVWWDIIKTVWETIKGIIKWLLKILLSPIKSIQNLFNQTMNPGYYSGQTDVKAKEELGVRLESLQSTERLYVAGEPVGVYATLSANTFDKPITAKISCKAKSNREKKAEDYDIIADEEDILPRTEYVFEDYSQEEIDCTFRNAMFERGTHKVSMFVDFDFETQAYLKMYFVDKERARALRRQKKDILEVYKVPDKDPKAIFTDGPLLVGMSTGKQPPLELDMQNQDYNRFTLGLTLSNRWQGRIGKVAKLALMMPKSLSIEGRQCGSLELVDGSCQDMKLACDPKIYRVYRSKPNDPDLDAIDSFKTVRCPVTISATSLLQDSSPLITEFIRVNAEYHYTLEKSISVNVKEALPDG